MKVETGEAAHTVGGGPQSITVELDEDTVLCLAKLGRPREVLVHLAQTAADGLRAHGVRGRLPLASLAYAPQHPSADTSCEREQLRAMLVDQREANATMVGATIRAQEVRDEADSAKRRAEKSERELRTVAEFREMFIGILGHDLRNPLGSIGIASALLLRRGRLNEQDAETVARIVRGSERMTTMVTQLLDLTRARLGGGLPIERAPTDIRRVCEQVVEEFATPVRLTTEGDLTGNWDRDRLAEVFSNLTGNALEYATAGTGVAVHAHAEVDVVVVEVTNVGAPIPEEVRPFIFEPFRRGRQQEKSASGNLGLGLYIAHEIVVSHGGTLDARSAHGLTTFVVRLPRDAT